MGPGSAGRKEGQEGELVAELVVADVAKWMDRVHVAGGDVRVKGTGSRAR